MGSTLIDESLSYQGWFSNASKAVNGVISAEDIAREYCAGMARYSPTVTGQLKPYGFSGSSSQLYPCELDKPYPEAAAVLHRLSQHYKLGIIANQNAGAALRLAQYGLQEYFNVIAASAEAGFSKPDLQLFKLALEQADCMPNQTVMIGDRPDNDIFPAKHLGMQTIRIIQGYSAFQEPSSEEYNADATVISLGELPGLLLR